MITKSTQINAPINLVWQVLTSPDFMTAWSYEFTEGAKVTGDFEIGGNLFFKDNSGNGLKAEITELIDGTSFKYIYTANYSGGIEDSTSEDFTKWTGSYDKYTLTEENGVTTLNMEIVTPAEYEDDFQHMWDVSLSNIKAYSETLAELQNEGFEHFSVVDIPHGDSPEHTHDHESVHVILYGDLIITDQEGEHTYTAGDKVIFPAGSTHKTNSQDDKGLMIIGYKFN